MQNEKLTEETMDKLREAGSTEELWHMAKACGCEMDRDEAEKLFAAMQKSCELTDEELASAAGGLTLKSFICPFCFSDRIEKVDVYIELGSRKIHCNRKCNACNRYYNA